MSKLDSATKHFEIGPWKKFPVTFEASVAPKGDRFWFDTYHGTGIAYDILSVKWLKLKNGRGIAVIVGPLHTVIAWKRVEPKPEPKGLKPMNFREWEDANPDLAESVKPCKACDGKGSCECDECGDVHSCHECGGSGKDEVKLYDAYYKQRETDEKRLEAWMGNYQYKENTSYGQKKDNWTYPTASA